MKRLYMMCPKTYELFTASCNPPKLLVVTAGNAPSWNKYRKASEFWEALAALYQFDLATLEPPRAGEHTAYFRAVPLP